MRRAAAFLMLLAPVSTAATAEDFRCANRQVEIRCADGACDILSADQGFTPMELARDGDTLSLCAYSGCWEGKVETLHEAGGVSLLHSTLRRPAREANGGQEERAAIAIIHDSRAAIAQISWKGFANLMNCGG